MKRKLVSTGAAFVIGIATLVGAAQADSKGQNGYMDKQGWQGKYGFFRGYGTCLRTQPDEFNGTIAEAAAATPELSTLLAAVGAAGLGEALDNENANLTVFAPVNSAFDAVPFLGNLTADEVKNVLLYHVVDGSVDPRRSIVTHKAKTLLGQNVFLSYDGNPQINQSNTGCKAVQTTNGTVWLIDSVLMPQYFPAS
jgi:uncharacterized surface protein with fasciclin (FAS1) repeats